MLTRKTAELEILRVTTQSRTASNAVLALIEANDKIAKPSNAKPLDFSGIGEPKKN